MLAVRCSIVKNLEVVKVDYRGLIRKQDSLISVVLKIFLVDKKIYLGINVETFGTRLGILEQVI